MSFSDSEDHTNVVDDTVGINDDIDRSTIHKPTVGERMTNLKENVRSKVEPGMQRLRNKMEPGMQRLRGAMKPKVQRRRIVEYRHNPIHDTTFNILGGFCALLSFGFFFFSEFIWHFLMADAPLFRLEDRIVLKCVGAMLAGFSALNFATKHMSHRLLNILVWGAIANTVLMFWACFNYRSVLSWTALLLPLIQLASCIQLCLAAFDIMPIHERFVGYGGAYGEVEGLRGDYHGGYGIGEGADWREHEGIYDQQYTRQPATGLRGLLSGKNRDEGVYDRDDQLLRRNEAVVDESDEGWNRGDAAREPVRPMSNAPDQVPLGHRSYINRQPIGPVDTAAYPTEYVEQDRDWDKGDRRFYSKTGGPYGGNYWDDDFNRGSGNRYGSSGYGSSGYSGVSRQKTGGGFFSWLFGNRMSRKAESDYYLSDSDYNRASGSRGFYGGVSQPQDRSIFGGAKDRTSVPQRSSSMKSKLTGTTGVTDKGLTSRSSSIGGTGLAEKPSRVKKSSDVTIPSSSTTKTLPATESAKVKEPVEEVITTTTTTVGDKGSMLTSGKKAKKTPSIIDKLTGNTEKGSTRTEVITD